MKQPKSPADAWEAHAAWYHDRHGRDGDRHHREIIMPALLRHLRLKPGMQVLDCCCGQGVIGRQLVQQGVTVTGVDGSASLIKAAQESAGEHETYLCADAHDVSAVLGHQQFDAGLIVLALQDLDPIDDVCAGLAAHLRPGSDLLIVMTHPCFRIPRHSDWFYDRRQDQQKRVLDSYMSPEAITIQIGADADASHSTHYHRPLHYYIRALGRAGFGILDAEELTSPHRGSSGTRSAAEDRAQREFPMFLLLKARRL